ncbi:Fanconi anemia group E protein [Odontesthes bonariensis]|uniref:Fanconi anemia group E protein n=1 Tax=Odontesthes bonariensis TaxID=219752 RepID=UPI003F58DD6F
MLLSRFDGRSRLLLRALASGTSGTLRALTVFRRQQRTNPDISLSNFIETLCQDEIASPETGTEPLAVKPLVCLFSASFKQNLLSFIYAVHSSVPGTTILCLLKCLSQDSHPNPWVTALSRQLKCDLGTHHNEPLYSQACSQRLKELSESLVGFGETGGWAKCFSSQTVRSESQSEPDLSELGTQRKRRASFVHVDPDVEETGQQSKRIRLDNESFHADEGGVKHLMPGGSDSAAPAEAPAADSQSDVLPEHMKASVVQIKELLENQAEWDQNSTDVFKVLNDCSPGQVEVLCSVLRLPDLPEHSLMKLCNSILSLSPDLSYSTAASLIRSLLLGKVLSLSEPASRCLMTAVTSLCSHYPRPMCHAVIGPMLEEKNIGHLQAELLNRLIEGSLDSHYRLLVLQMTFRITWSEAVLSIIHSLLDSKPVLNEEVFTQFTEQLASQGGQFTKSVKFAKMVLTVLGKYSSYVTAANKQSLNSCLMLNETFLKKSLQAALKRIAHS